MRRMNIKKRRRRRQLRRTFRGRHGELLGQDMECVAFYLLIFFNINNINLVTVSLPGAIRSDRLMFFPKMFFKPSVFHNFINLLRMPFCLCISPLANLCEVHISLGSSEHFT